MAEKHLPNIKISHQGKDFLEHLFTTHYTEMVRYAKALVNSSAAAEDLVQDAYLLAATKIVELQNHPKPRAWLFQTIRYLAINENRRQAAALASVDKLSFYEKSVYFLDETHLLLEECKKVLSDTDWDILYDFHCAGLSYEEIAGKYNMSVAACKMRASRAKRLIQSRFDKSTEFHIGR